MCGLGRFTVDTMDVHDEYDNNASPARGMVECGDCERMIQEKCA